jgi:hypothetical protein
MNNKERAVVSDGASVFPWIRGLLHLVYPTNYVLCLNLLMEAEPASETLYIFNEGVQLVSQFHNTNLSQALSCKGNDCADGFYGH